MLVKIIFSNTGDRVSKGPYRADTSPKHRTSEQCQYNSTNRFDNSEMNRSGMSSPLVSLAWHNNWMLSVKIASSCLSIYLFIQPGLS